MRYGFWLVVAALQAASLGTACDAQAQLLVNELLAAPARDWNSDAVVSSRDDEWVELYNPTNSPILLDGYRIADADTSWRMGLTGTLGPHAYRLVFGSESLEWEKATHHTASGLSLNNAGDTIRLWKFTGSDSAQVDVVTYGSNEGGTDRAYGRFPDGASTWKVFDALNPLGSGTGCSPSPGTSNGCVTAVTHPTWGLMRRVYTRPDSLQGRPGAR